MDEKSQDPFEMGKGDPLIHQKPLNLVKHGGVGYIGVAPIGSTRGNDLDRRTLALHHPDLDRGGVSA